MIFILSYVLIFYFGFYIEFRCDVSFIIWLDNGGKIFRLLFLIDINVFEYFK